MIDVLCVDLSQSNLDYDMKYILENLGDHYFSQTAAQMNGITEDDFVSSYRMTSSVVSKGKYQRYGSVQKSDGMATQFGYTETYAVLNENKLTVVSGAFLSSDMMERQSFSQLMFIPGTAKSFMKPLRRSTRTGRSLSASETCSARQLAARSRHSAFSDTTTPRYLTTAQSAWAA